MKLRSGIISTANFAVSAIRPGRCRSRTSASMCMRHRRRHPHPAVVFSTHMDTVPPFISSSEDAGRIYGRGSCDAKGIIAAQIAAAERLRQQGIYVGLLFVVGEERDSLGAQVANEYAAEEERDAVFWLTENRRRIASRSHRKGRCASKSLRGDAWRTRRIRSWASPRSTS